MRDACAMTLESIGKVSGMIYLLCGLNGREVKEEAIFIGTIIYLASSAYGKINQYTQNVERFSQLEENIKNHIDSKYK